MEKRIGIIGVGNIGMAILRGLLAGGREKIFINDENREKLRYFESDRDPETGSRVEVCESNEEVAKRSEVIILAVKPPDVRGVVEEIAPFMNKGKGKILISVAAGVPTRAIEEYLGEGRKVIRVMPNIGARVREAVCAICKGEYAEEEDEEIAKEILSAIGEVYTVKESDMDVITGLSGSGIAFFAAVIDAMADGGVYEGMPRELSETIAARTAIGAAKMILAGEKPSEIKAMTASPGGTTIRGIYAMESRDVKAAMMEAVIEATRRAKEISKNLS